MAKNSFFWYVGQGFKSFFHGEKRQVKDNYIYITAEEVIEFNKKITSIDGLLRDRAGLESAIMRPQMAYHYENADIVRQAALLTDRICMVHAFIDGNKRTALIACVTFLELNGFTLKNAHGLLGKEIEALVVGRDMDHFLQWLRQHIRPL